MSEIKITYKKGPDVEELISLCPFGAIEETDDGLEINSGCKMCRICVKQKPDIFQFIEDEIVEAIDKSLWQGILVYVDHFEGSIHPVTIELIGKAKELAKKSSQRVYCLLAGNEVKHLADELLEYGVEKVFVYESPALKHFRIEPYASVFESFVKKVKPSVVLVGGTPIGRSLAPRVAARFRTGLTADCTVLDISENTDLDQIRPAYGGNIMAHILTPNHRPQFATVRYKIFNAPEKVKPFGTIELCEISEDKLLSNISVLEVKKKEKVKTIEDAEVIVVAGMGVKKKEDLGMIYELADSLGAMTAGTRPLIEMGWFDPRLQIGLSGRTVKPKLIITCGVSGSVQFAAGMQGGDTIIAINKDPDAPIFNLAHYAVVGDIYEVIPLLLNKIKKQGSVL